MREISTKALSNSASFFPLLNYFQLVFVSMNKLKKKSAEIYYSPKMWLICKIMQIKMQLGSNSLVEFSIII